MPKNKHFINFDIMPEYDISAFISLVGTNKITRPEMLIKQLPDFFNCHETSEQKNIEIIIEMSNSSGIFQVEETLGKKVIGSPLENYMEITAILVPAEKNYDKRIVRSIRLKGRKFVSG